MGRNRDGVPFRLSPSRAATTGMMDAQDRRRRRVEQNMSAGLKVEYSREQLCDAKKKMR